MDYKLLNSKEVIKAKAQIVPSESEALESLFIKIAPPSTEVNTINEFLEKYEKDTEYTLDGLVSSQRYRSFAVEGEHVVGLTIIQCNLQEIPTEITEFKELRELDLSFNYINSVAPLYNLLELEVADLSENLLDYNNLWLSSDEIVATPYLILKRMLDPAFYILTSERVNPIYIINKITGSSYEPINELKKVMNLIDKELDNNDYPNLRAFKSMIEPIIL